MKVSAILLRWYRSFNVTAVGPDAQQPTERWHQFREANFPFVRVPIDGRITSIVGANESGKSHLLSALSKVFNGAGTPGPTTDKYEIKDVCRYSGFSPLEELWADIGIELSVTPAEVSLFEQKPDAENASTQTPASGRDELQTLTVILNGGKDTDFATVYKNDAVLRTFAEDDWFAFVEERLPKVECLDSRLALPNEVHIDELLDLYADKKPSPVVEPLSVQDLWRELEGIQVIDGGAINEATAKRVEQLKKAIEKALRKPQKHEGRLVRLLFEDILGVTTEHLERMREYSVSERGYVSSMNDDINRRIARELDITQYWDQDEDFKLSVNYKGGFFHFQITDRTGSTYTFNERSSGLRYFLSYYIQAKAIERSHSTNGSIILMDEPDNFLSASAQRSLLRVFEALVGAKVAKGTCQLIYTTHSPFLINRNFPARIRLVRKGDGAEGTQYVHRSAVRRFEPIRSALSIDAADTLFLGSTNVILEGPADQKLLEAIS